MAATRGTPPTWEGGPDGADPAGPAAVPDRASAREPPRASAAATRTRGLPPQRRRRVAAGSASALGTPTNRRGGCTTPPPPGSPPVPSGPGRPPAAASPRGRSSSLPSPGPARPCSLRYVWCARWLLMMFSRSGMTFCLPVWTRCSCDLQL